MLEAFLLSLIIKMPLFLYGENPDLVKGPLEYFEWPQSAHHLNKITGGKGLPIQLDYLSTFNYNKSYLQAIKVHLVSKVGSK